MDDERKKYFAIRRAQQLANAVWTRDMPTTGQSPSRQYPLIRGNFDALETANDRNHFDITDINKRGLHTRIDMFPFDNPPPTFPCNPVFATLYALKNGKLQYRDNTGKIFDLLGQFNRNRKGYYIFPEGLIIQWDTVYNIKNNDYIHYPMAFPNECYHVNPHLIRGNNEPRVIYEREASTTRERWRVATNASSTTVSYFAIGA